MHIVLDFVAFALGFVPMLSIVAILLALFWAATKLFPSLNEWMSRTDDMAEAQSNNTYDYDQHNRPIDYYV